MKKQKARSNRNHQQPALQAANTSGDNADTGALPVKLQQTILDLFQRAFPLDQNQSDLRSTIQEVKGHLFQRDFSRAFAKPEYLDAYALRWSASRALGYAAILFEGDLQQTWAAYVANVPSSADASVLTAEPRPAAGACKVVCIGGGGGAEMVACAAAARTFLPSSTKVSVSVVDIADWSTCLHKLENTMCTPPPLSAYASESAKTANRAFISSDSFHFCFSQHDILEVGEAKLRDLVQDMHICTIMFALNELFSASIARTTAFLLALTETTNPGTWLLVVDSPGSYSEVKLGKGEDTKTRQYPMKWLLDHTLLEVAGEGDDSKWKKVVSDDSRWFRLPQPALKYPIELENMRYQIHLYQRL